MARSRPGQDRIDARCKSPDDECFRIPMISRMRFSLGARSEFGIIALGFGLMILHNIDEAFIHPEDGGKTNLVVVGVVGVLVLSFSHRLPALWRAGVLAVLGLLGLVQGILGHVVNIFAGKATAIDYSGVLFALGGAVLLGLGVTVFMQRGARSATQRT